METTLSLARVEKRLQIAAARGDFAVAQAVALDYVRAVELAASSLQHPAAASLIQQAVGTLEKARRQLCVARTRLALKLRAITCRMRYEQLGAATHTWRMEG